MNNTQTADAVKRDVYDIVTELTIEQLEKGKIPWHGHEKAISRS